MQYCTQIVYGYVGIEPNTFRVIPLEHRQHQIFSQVKDLKRKHPNIKFLLSLGGDKDLKQATKYMRLLEAAGNKQEKFIKSAVDILNKYNFDGLDLAYQLPRNEPQKHHSKLGVLWKKAKSVVTKESKGDKSTDRHKQQLSNLIYQLRTALKRSRHMLTLTVLPNVNSTCKYEN